MPVASAVEVGLERDQFKRKMAAARGAIADGKFREIHSLLLYKNGALIFEEYFPGNSDTIDFEGGVKRVTGPQVKWHQGRKHYVASVTKTITAILTGIALDQLKVPVTARAGELLPSRYNRQLVGSAQRITLHDILTMTAGFKWDEWSGPDLVKLWQSRDFVAHVLRRPNFGPGTDWAYNSALPNMLLMMLETRLEEPLEEWAHEHFFEELGITDYDWHRQPGRTPEGSARLHLRPLDMMKIGVTMLKGGKWQNKQVIPRAWVQKMSIAHAKPDTGNYGYYVWLREIDGVGYISADGDGGQYINIFPEHDMVMVITQGNYLEWPLYAQQTEALMRDYIFPAVGLR